MDITLALNNIGIRCGFDREIKKAHFVLLLTE